MPVVAKQAAKKGVAELPPEDVTPGEGSGG